jgi:predicted flavoprotein YhiN
MALRPDHAAADLLKRLAAPRAKQSLSTCLRKTLKLPPVAVGLLHEATQASPARLTAMDSEALAALINAVSVRLTGMAPLATAGGIAFADGACGSA